MPFEEYCLPRIIHRTHHPHKCIRGLFGAGDLSVPAFAIDSCGKYHLSPAIIDTEVIDLRNPDSERSDDIIQAIIIGRKGSRDKYRCFCFEYTHHDKCGISTTINGKGWDGKIAG